MAQEEYTITLKFNSLPNNCSECPLYQSTYWVDDEPWFGDGIHHYCPYGGSNFGAAVERPEGCPIGTTVILYNEEERIDMAFDTTTFNYPVKKQLFKQLLEEEKLSADTVIERINQPHTYSDLLTVAKVCGYKPGWAYYEALKLNLPTPRVLYDERHYDEPMETFYL